MTAILRPALVVVVLFTLLLGLAVPVAFTGVAGAIFPTQAGGSLIERDGRVIGSALLGQNVTSERYFHPRPSATTEPDPGNEGSMRAAPYNAAASAASQLGPTSAALLEAITQRVAGRSHLPADAATASGSGLDPHISPENALEQAERVARARGLQAQRVRALVDHHTEGRELGLFGDRRVNVLRLNLALDGWPG